MFKIGEYMVYRRDVCKLVEIKKGHYKNNDYYVLAPISDDSLKIEIPIDNDFKNLRPLISKQEIENIINEIPNIEVITSVNRLIENEYKELINSGNHLDLIKIIKTTSFRNQERIDNKKKASDNDKTYFNQAEKYLYQEFSIVLGMSYEDTKKYVINEVNKLK